MMKIKQSYLMQGIKTILILAYSVFMQKLNAELISNFQSIAETKATSSIEVKIEENSTKYLIQENINFPENYAIFIIGQENRTEPDIHNKFLVESCKAVKRLDELNVEDEKINMFYSNPEDLAELDNEYKQILEQKVENNTLCFTTNKNTILNKIKEITAKLDENDTLLLYLTGHGAIYSETERLDNASESCLIYQNNDLNQNQDIIKSEEGIVVIKASDILGGVSNNLISQITIYSGSCYAGSFLGIYQDQFNCTIITSSTELEQSISSNDNSFGNLLLEYTEDISNVKKGFDKAKEKYFLFQLKLQYSEIESNPSIRP